MPLEERIVHPNHHDAYVTTAEWEEIQEILRTNAPSKLRRNLGPGRALLQGILRCGIGSPLHAKTKAMQPHYKFGKRSHLYQCRGDYAENVKLCGTVPGRAVDQAIVDAVLARLAPPKLEAVREAFLQAKHDEQSETRRQKIELDRARRHCADLKAKLDAVDAANRRVSQMREAELEEALGEKDRLEEQQGLSQAVPTVVFDDAAFTELIDLCRDVRALWDAPTTTYRDRKEILRTLIDHVLIERRDREEVGMRIVWADGDADTDVEIKLCAYKHRMIRELAAQGLSDEEIARRLNAMGLRTAQHYPWCRNTVHYTIWTMRRRASRHKAVGDFLGRWEVPVDHGDRARRDMPRAALDAHISQAARVVDAGDKSTQQRPTQMPLFVQPAA